MKNIFRFLFTAMFVVSISAQQSKNAGSFIETCGGFNMPVIVPPGDFDSSFVVKPVSDQDSKITSIDPCDEKETEKTKSVREKSAKILFAPKK